jgi:hypothetical protein
VNSSVDPVYASSSTVLTSISNLVVPIQSIDNVHERFLNELDHVLRLKYDKHRQYPLSYSQSCRQQTELLPFEIYRSVSPSLTIQDLDFSSDNNSRNTIYARTAKHSNATLVRKARLEQLKDDTAILY